MEQPYMYYKTHKCHFYVTVRLSNLIANSGVAKNRHFLATKFIYLSFIDLLTYLTLLYDLRINIFVRWYGEVYVIIVN